MKTPANLIHRMAALSLLATALALSPRAGAQNPATTFDVNDVSFLFPVPTNRAEADACISITEKIADGANLWPADIFKQTMDVAKGTRVRFGPRATTMQVSDPAMFEEAKMWKVAGIRVHPSALGVHEGALREFGEIPTLRLVVQPVTVRGENDVEVHDVAAHVVFNFMTLLPDGKPGPDRPRFGALVEDLKKLKALGGAGTAKLGVHPAIKKPGFRDGLVDLLKEHVKAPQVFAVSFMGIDDPEPWIFFPMRKEGGTFVQGDVKGGFSPQTKLQLFGPRASADKVVPVPKPNPATGEGLSTAALFKRGALSTLGAQLLPGATRLDLAALTIRDVPDRIANTALHHNFNTDCVSCHTETTLRNRIKPATGSSAVAYQHPANISKVDPVVLPVDEWNVRNFGWGPERGEFKPTISQRAANEAADSAAFINKVYLAQTPAERPAGQAEPPAPAPRETRRSANPLTLIMDIERSKLPALKQLLTKMESAPAAENEVRNAMDKLGIVHFARFVFIGDEKLAVITTFDGELERYIGAFTREIGHIFDALLSHMKDHPPLPVQRNEKAFLKYVKEHDAKALSFYSAYPTLSTQDILALQPKPAEEIAPK
ncbi:MAG: hypothetical protein M3463_13905 [Verrucomicrobiota bacterium]|nr:hypothetical protein [Verrucomicrobiota bacterium]